MKLRENSDAGFHDSVSNQKQSLLSVLAEKESGKLQQRQNPSTEPVALQINQESGTLPVIPEAVPNNLKPLNPDGVIDASQSTQKGRSMSVVRETEPDNLRQRQSLDSGNLTSESCQEGSSLSTIPEKELDNLQQTQSPNTGTIASETNQDGRTLPILSEIVPEQQCQDPDIELPASQSDQEKFTLSIKPEKVLGKLPLRRNPDIGVPALQSAQEGNTLGKIPEKPSEDGYNWRKYGQKLVRGNQFVRSYYKCTFPNCSEKKQVERSHEGNITNINYRGKHEHPKPQHGPLIVPIQARRPDKPPLNRTEEKKQVERSHEGNITNINYRGKHEHPKPQHGPLIVPIQARRPDKPPLNRTEDESSDVHSETPHHVAPVETPKLLIAEASFDDDMESAASQSNKTIDEVDHDGNPKSKRRKKDISGVVNTLTLANRTNGESRLVVQTTSLVDIVNDGHRWRKYGQKLVKGNPNPRSYYRCSSTGCPVKKHVERASHDPKVVITTYEGQHDHDIPSASTVTHHASGANANVTPHNDESRSEPEEKGAAGLDMVVHVN